MARSHAQPEHVWHVQAFEGAHGVFLFTDFYVSAGMNAEKEIQQGKNAIDAAAQASTCRIMAVGDINLLLLYPFSTHFHGMLVAGCTVHHKQMLTRRQCYLNRHLSSTWFGVL